MGWDFSMIASSISYDLVMNAYDWKQKKRVKDTVYP